MKVIVATFRQMTVKPHENNFDISFRMISPLPGETVFGFDGDM